MCDQRKTQREFCLNHRHFKVTWDVSKATSPEKQHQRLIIVERGGINFTKTIQPVTEQVNKI